MKAASVIQVLQTAVPSLLTLTVLLHYLLSTTSAATNILIRDLFTRNRAIPLSVAWCICVAVFFYVSRRRRPVLLLDYACYKPDCTRKCSYEVCEYFVRRSRRFTAASEEFMHGIYLKSGLGGDTYAPPFIFQSDYEAKFRSAVQEAREGMFAAVDSLLHKTKISPTQIDIVVVTCGMFTACPSLSSMVVNHYGMKPGVKTYNLSGMGCSSGVVAVDMAANLLNRDGRVRYALVVATENISLNWYFGDNRSMLVTNCLFRVGAAAALVTNDPARRPAAKLELVHSLRTHHGADDDAYHAGFQEEDTGGSVGMALTRDLVRVAGECLRAHVRALAPRVLPLGELLSYGWRAAAAKVWDGENKAARLPDFSAAFEHMCVHTGGKAVIERVAAVMGLSSEATEAARMTLHRFGNTSSSLVFYELAYMEAKGKVKRGERMWMLAFGTGFKVCSLVWKSLNDSSMEADNPWKDCVHRYPLKAW